MSTLHQLYQTNYNTRSLLALVTILKVWSFLVHSCTVVILMHSTYNRIHLAVHMNLVYILMIGIKLLLKNISRDRSNSKYTTYSDIC